MSVGELDQRVTLQAPQRVSDGLGGVTKTWADFTDTPTVWARVEFRSASEQDEAAQTTARQVVRFKLRNRQDVDERHRIVWRGEPYNIRTVRRLGVRAMYMMIDAERGVAD